MKGSKVSIGMNPVSRDRMSSLRKKCLRNCDVLPFLVIPDEPQQHRYICTAIGTIDYEAPECSK